MSDGLEFKDFFTQMSKEHGTFEDHISKSIPGYAELSLKTAQFVSQFVGSGQRVLDIGSSEGYWGDVVASGTRAAIFSLDPNFEMWEKWNNKPYRNDMVNHHFAQAAFGDGFLDGIEWIGGFSPAIDFNVIRESMTFKFLSSDRDMQYGLVKDWLTSDGLFITNSKCLLPEHPGEYELYEYLKDNYKRQFFTEEQLTKKATEVLPNMGKYMVSVEQTVCALKKHFTFVTEYWVSGNFHGFLASNDLETITKALIRIPEFKEVISGRVTTDKYINNIK